MIDTDQPIDLLREKIDAIDQQLMVMINQRAKLAIEIGQIKKLQQESIVYRPEREVQILRKIMKHNPGPIDDNDMAQIFQTVISITRSLQQPLKIAFLGPQGTFSHNAVIKNFGPSIILAPQESIHHVFQQVELKSAQFGVVPIENSTEGVVNITLDEMANTSLKICGEIYLQVHQNLLVNPQHQAPIQRIYSHPQSLAQCRNWLNQHYPQAEIIAVSSNSQAAKMAASEQNAAAIGGILAAEKYDLEIRAQNIEDNPDNTTRFLVIGHQDVPASGHDKTMLLIYTSNTPGALARISEPFAKHHINITLPLLRPSKHKMWNYIFFLDVEGHQSDEHVNAALKDLEQQSVAVRILGSYPKTII